MPRHPCSTCWWCATPQVTPRLLLACQAPGATKSIHPGTRARPCTLHSSDFYLIPLPQASATPPSSSWRGASNPSTSAPAWTRQARRRCERPQLSAGNCAGACLLPHVASFPSGKQPPAWPPACLRCSPPWCLGCCSRRRLRRRPCCGGARRLATRPPRVSSPSLCTRLPPPSVAPLPGPQTLTFRYTLPALLPLGSSCWRSRARQPSCSPLQHARLCPSGLPCSRRLLRQHQSRRRRSCPACSSSVRR